MAEQAKPRISNITKFFVPGLVIGLVAGGLGGAYYSSSFEAPTMTELKPKGQSPAAHPTGRGEPLPAPETPKNSPPPAATGTTGPSGATGSTQGEAPAPK